MSYRSSHTNTILLYKWQHDSDPIYPTLSKESFVFAMQTEFQKVCYQQHATKVLCVDATNGTNAYGFKLITVMVTDEFGEGKVYIQCNLCNITCVHVHDM